MGLRLLLDGGTGHCRKTRALGVACCGGGRGRGGGRAERADAEEGVATDAIGKPGAIRERISELSGGRDTEKSKAGRTQQSERTQQDQHEFALLNEFTRA